MQAFISYPREREEDVKYLATALGNRGFRILLDRDSIQPGQDWDEAIRNGIRRSRAFVVLFDQVAITGSRPVFELQRRCDPESFDAIVASLERTWADATPVRPGG